MELPTARKVNIICSEGDILLQGAEQGNGDLLLVSSHVLSKASENLSEILRIPQMPQGQSLPALKEITLPRDSLDALLIICNILHGRDRHVPETMPLDKLKAVAQSCSRHQLTEPLRAWSPRWLEYASGVASKNERYVIIALAVDFGVHPPRNEPVSWRPCQRPGTTGHYLTGMIWVPSSSIEDYQHARRWSPLPENPSHAESCCRTSELLDGHVLRVSKVQVRAFGFMGSAAEESRTTTVRKRSSRVRFKRPDGSLENSRDTRSCARLWL